MKRYLYDTLLSDLNKKMVLLTGPRQVGKTTLAKELMSEFGRAQYLNWYMWGRVHVGTYLIYTFSHIGAIWYERLYHFNSGMGRFPSSMFTY